MVGEGGEGDGGGVVERKLLWFNTPICKQRVWELCAVTPRMPEIV